MKPDTVPLIITDPLIKSFDRLKTTVYVDSVRGEP